MQIKSQYNYGEGFVRHEKFAAQLEKYFSPVGQQFFPNEGVNFPTRGISMTLVGGLELFQEAYVILREHTKVADLVFQVCDTLYTHAESIAAISLGVDATLL